MHVWPELLVRVTVLSQSYCALYGTLFIPTDCICRENRYLLFLTENYAALDILRHYLSDVVCSSPSESVVAIPPASNGSGEGLLEKMEPFILFGSSFPKDKEYTQVGTWKHLHGALL